MTTYLPDPDVRPAGADEPLPLLVTVERRPDHVVVALDGDLDLTARDHLGGVLGHLVAGGVRAIHVDAAGVTFADAAGLGTLLTARRRAQAARTPFHTTATSPALDRVLAVTGTHDAIGLVPIGTLA